jgi:hypothetical protein
MMKYFVIIIALSIFVNNIQAQDNFLPLITNVIANTWSVDVPKMIDNYAINFVEEASSSALTTYHSKRKAYVAKRTSVLNADNLRAVMDQQNSFVQWKNIYFDGMHAMLYPDIDIYSTTICKLQPNTQVAKAKGKLVIEYQIVLSATQIVESIIFCNTADATEFRASCNPYFVAKDPANTPTSYHFFTQPLEKMVLDFPLGFKSYKGTETETSGLWNCTLKMDNSTSKSCDTSKMNCLLAFSESEQTEHSLFCVLITGFANTKEQNEDFNIATAISDYQSFLQNSDTAKIGTWAVDVSLTPLPMLLQKGDRNIKLVYKLCNPPNQQLSALRLHATFTNDYLLSAQSNVGWKVTAILTDVKYLH